MLSWLSFQILKNIPNLIMQGYINIMAVKKNPEGKEPRRIKNHFKLSIDNGMAEDRAKGNKIIQEFFNFNVVLA